MNQHYMRRPCTFKIEMTRGCNLRCRFCPVYEITDLHTARDFMLPTTMNHIMPGIRDLNPKGRIELTRRGEPTLNPHLEENVSLMRQHTPQMQISLFTNGVEFIREKSPRRIVALLDAGVNIINIDCYDSAKDVGLAKMYDRFKKMLQSLPNTIEQRDFREFSAYQRFSGGHKLRVVNLVPDIADPVNPVKVRKIHNAAGNTNRAIMANEFNIHWPESPLKKNCAKPYRELTVNFDGIVPLCCEDWSTECVLGDLTKHTASEVWYSDFHRAILQSLYAKDRSGVPCNKCTFHGGYRLGLLQNPNEARP